jgi:hypothetical protein
LQVRVVDHVTLGSAARRYQVIRHGLDLIRIAHHQQGRPTAIELADQLLTFVFRDTEASA